MRVVHHEAGAERNRRPRSVAGRQDGQDQGIRGYVFHERRNDDPDPIAVEFEVAIHRGRRGFASNVTGSSTSDVFMSCHLPL